MDILGLSDKANAAIKDATRNAETKRFDLATTGLRGLAVFEELRAFYVTDKGLHISPRGVVSVGPESYLYGDIEELVAQATSMEIVIKAPNAAPLHTTLEQWLLDNPAETEAKQCLELSGCYMPRSMLWSGSVIYAASAWEKRNESRLFYVSAKPDPNAKKGYLMAGPYDTEQEANARISDVSEYAREIDTTGRAHFMAWGVSSYPDATKTPLGKF